VILTRIIRGYPAVPRSAGWPESFVKNAGGRRGNLGQGEASLAKARVREQILRFLR